MTQDPVLAALKRVEAKQDEALANQAAMNVQLAQIHRDCQKTALISGGAAGAVTGSLITTAIELMRIKLGW